MTTTRWLLLIPWTYAVLAVQASGVPVPLVFPAAMVTAVVCGGPTGLLYASLTGLLSEALGSGGLGAGVITYTLSAAVLMRWCANSGLRLGLVIAALSGLATIAAQGIVVTEPLLLNRLALAGGSAALWSLPPALVLAIAASRLGLLTGRVEDRTKLDVANRWSMLTN